ncbi:acyl-CoA thioesterase [Endozoicomonas arenosclerae]|uniref:acyl-CoA thioesterase n=1 Tax=Endozoicomonas arenosclerae TaxID=1633495 RepID=UPI0007826C3F|nr:thioesterase family protein [Endozoicomonas arenosclerae]
MARVEVEIPEQFAFSTEVEVLYCHVNAAGHMGNDSLVGIINEARTRYLKQPGLNTIESESKGLINADLAVIYKSEAKHGETLVIDITAQAFQKYGCDFVYQVKEKVSGRVVAIAKTAMLMFDYEVSGLAQVPDHFEGLFS